MYFRIATVLVLAALATPCGASGRMDVFAGPVDAIVMRVIDGDTVDVEAHIWPGQSLRVAVRIRGVDAPKLHGKCDREKSVARDARAALSDLLGSGRASLVDISGDKYYGRVIADVVTADGKRASEFLLTRGLARPYRGHRREPWCD